MMKREGNPILANYFANGQVLAVAGASEPVQWTDGDLMADAYGFFRKSDSVSVPRSGLYRVSTFLYLRGSAGVTSSEITTYVGGTQVLKTTDNVPVPAGENHVIRQSVLLHLLPQDALRFEWRAMGGTPSINGSGDSRLELEWLGEQGPQL